MSYDPLRPYGPARTFGDRAHLSWLAQHQPAPVRTPRPRVQRRVPAFRLRRSAGQWSSLNFAPLF